MADRVRFSVSAIPIETLTDENSQTHDVIASEVKRSLGGGGDSVDLTAYNGTAANQGYLNATVNYKIASHEEIGTQLTATEPDFFFIKNTGYKFSSATALGASTTDCVLVAIQTAAYSVGAQSGWSTDSGEVAHYFEVAWLKPGQAIVLPAGANKVGITQFGANAADLTNLNNDDANGTCEVFVRTFQSDGSAASSGNAVEYLAVT